MPRQEDRKLKERARRSQKAGRRLAAGGKYSLAFKEGTALFYITLQYVLKS